MARIVGVDLPRNKRILIALTYMLALSQQKQRILATVGIDGTTRVKDLSESGTVSIRDEVRKHVTEGDLRRHVDQDVKRLMDIGTYRGNRHKRKLPARGHTHTNARTKKANA